MRRGPLLVGAAVAAVVGFMAWLARDSDSLLTVSAIGRLGYPKWIDLVLGAGFVLAAILVVAVVDVQRWRQPLLEFDRQMNHRTVAMMVSIIVLLAMSFGRSPIFLAVLAAAGAYALSMLGEFLSESRPISPGASRTHRIEVVLGAVIGSLLIVQVGAVLGVLITTRFSSLVMSRNPVLVGSALAVAALVLAAIVVSRVLSYPGLDHSLARLSALSPVLFIGLLVSFVVDERGNLVVVRRSGAAAVIVSVAIVLLLAMLISDELRGRGASKRHLKIGLLGGVFAVGAVGNNMLSAGDPFHMGEVSASYSTAIANGLGNAFVSYVPVPGLLSVVYGGVADALGDVATTLPIAIALVQVSAAIVGTMLVARAVGPQFALLAAPLFALAYRNPPLDRFWFVLVAFAVLIQPEIRSHPVRILSVGSLLAGAAILLVPAIGIPFAGALALSAVVQISWSWRRKRGSVSLQPERKRLGIVWPAAVTLIAISTIALLPTVVAAIRSTLAFAAVNTYAFGLPLFGSDPSPATSSGGGIGKVVLLVLGSLAIGTAVVVSHARRFRGAPFVTAALIFYVATIPYSLGRIDPGPSRLNGVLLASLLLAAVAMAIPNDDKAPARDLRSRPMIAVLLALALGSVGGFLPLWDSAGSMIVWQPERGFSSQMRGGKQSDEAVAAVEAMAAKGVSFLDFSNRPAVMTIAGIEFDGPLPHAFATATPNGVAALVTAIRSREFDVVWLGPNEFAPDGPVPLRHWLVSAALFGSGNLRPAVLSGQEFLVSDSFKGPDELQYVGLDELTSYGSDWTSGYFGEDADLAALPVLGSEPVVVDVIAPNRYRLNRPPSDLGPAIFLQVTIACSNPQGKSRGTVSFIDATGETYRLSFRGRNSLIPIGGIPAWQMESSETSTLELIDDGSCPDPTLASAEWGGVDLAAIGS